MIKENFAYNFLGKKMNTPSLKTVERLVAAICLLTSIGIIFSWYLGEKALLSIIPGSATMKFNTALIFLFAGINTAICRKEKSKMVCFVHNSLAALCILIGVLTLVEYGGLSFIRIDNLFVTDTFSEYNPGRMSLAAALCSVLTGLGFLGFGSSRKAINRIGLYSSKIVAIISLIAIIAFILVLPTKTKTSFFQTMAIHTSVLFLAISGLLLLKSPFSRFGLLVTGGLAGSRIVRRLLPIVVLLPIISSYFLLLGINREVISSDFGIVAYAILTIPLSIIYVSMIAQGLNKTDIRRRLLAENLRKSNEKLRQFKHGLDQVSIVAITDQRGIIKYVNDRFCQISQYSREELIGNTHALINSGYHPKEFFQSMWQTITSGEIWVNEIKNKAKDGTYYWVHTAIVPFRDDAGKIIEFLAIRQDITKRKEAEELLKSAYVQKLEYKNKELEQFAYVASHDLQEPLRTIMSFTDLFVEKHEQSFDETDKTFMRFIREATSRMSQLIKSLLDYSRLDKNSELELVDCNQLVEEVRQDLAKKIEDSGAKIIVDDLPSVMGYRTPLRLLFQNLTVNAIKFSKEGSIPEIRFSVKKQDDLWQFSVRDNGIGIANNHQEKIFVIFQRLHARNEFEGTGIGLAHCRKIVDLHGGEIWVDSRLGEGSTFSFTLPIER